MIHLYLFFLTVDQPASDLNTEQGDKSFISVPYIHQARLRRVSFTHGLLWGC